MYRTQLFNPADMPNVVKIQAGYKVQPLSAYLGQPAPPAPAKVEIPKIDKDLVKTEFFNHLDFAMQFSPAGPEEKAIREKLARIGVGAGKTFESKDLSAEQASLIAAGAFFGVGGFNPLIAGPEDNDILRRVALRGDVAPLRATVACVEWGEAGSTTNLTTHAPMSRWARERILDEAGCLARLRASATSSYWRGRIVRAYLTSCVWNLQRRRLSTALSRGLFTLTGLLLALPDLPSPAFWRAVVSSHAGEAFPEGRSRRSEERRHPEPVSSH